MSKAVLPSTTLPLFYGFIIYVSVQPILYWMVHKRFDQGHKIFFLGMMVVMSITILKNMSVIKDNLIIFLGIYMLWLINLGLNLNPIGKATFAHFQPILLPVLGINFGYLIARDRPDILANIYSGSYKLGLALSVIIISYFLLVQAGYIAYFGASSLIFIPIFWAFLEKKWTPFVLFMLILLLTGKRSSALAVTAVLVLSVVRNIDSKSALILLGAPSCLLLGLELFSDINSILFKRYEAMIESLGSIDVLSLTLSANELNLLNEATSGRINDFIGAANALNQNSIFWLTGKGIGGTFQVITTGPLWTTHYSHFTPISYVFLGGAILLIVFYSKLISLFVYSVKTIDDFYSMLFIYWFITALIGGAIYFTDPFIWLFVGVVVYKKRYKNKCARIKS